MIVISSREFRQNQKMYFDRVDAGEQIVVQRGKDKSYRIEPVEEDAFLYNKEMVEKIKRSLEEAKNGEVIRLDNPQQIKDLLGL